MYLCTVKQIHTKQYFLVRLEIVQILSYIHLTSSPVPLTQEIYFRYIQRLFDHQLIFHQITYFRDCKRSRLISTGFENKPSTSIPSMNCYLEKICKQVVLSGSWSLCMLKLSSCCTPVIMGPPQATVLPKWKGE